MLLEPEGQQVKEKTKPLILQIFHVSRDLVLGSEVETILRQLEEELHGRINSIMY